MASGDRKKTKYRSRKVNWDAEDRKVSKQYYDMVRESDDPVVTIGNMSGEALVAMHNATLVMRRGSTDWDRICNMIGSDAANAYERISDAEEAQKQIDLRAKEEWDAGRENRIAASKASQDAAALEYRNAAGLTAGALQSDFHQAFAMREKHGRLDGDWLDDPVGAYTTGYGFSEEVKVHSGVKLQVTISLDVSNSMWSNGIANDAIRAFVTLGTALEDLKMQFPDSLFTQGFVFAMGDAGKFASVVDGCAALRSYRDDEYKIGKYDGLRDHTRWEPTWAGDDTYIQPLFKAIEKWENAESDPGCVRLDLIITDGVLEHAMDVRDASVVQERRNGALRSVLLNFLPEDDWSSVSMPKRCVQYPVDNDNLTGLLRQLLAEFVSVYV